MQHETKISHMKSFAGVLSVWFAACDEWLTRDKIDKCACVGLPLIARLPGDIKVSRILLVASCTQPAPAGWGFTTDADRQRIEGFLRRSVRAGYAEWTSLRPPSWSKTLMISCSTGSSTSSATFYSHFFTITALTLMFCAIGVMTLYCLAESIH